MREDGGADLKVVVRLAASLRNHAGGAASVDVEVDSPASVADVLDALASSHPAVGRRLRDENGTLRRHVNIFVGADNARDLDGLETVMPEDTEISVMPAISGG